ncbi:Actin-depolymerizing factor [Hibiscus syriacus]|uniref:Actin-depolymerizing factor n=1 Tax=Hibiscus syriacus TaxID=106335 RepID=A0A6A3BNL9_HIBSY|nr:Actin-depolymerizing factor [Hibiscus syriacus]
MGVSEHSKSTYLELQRKKVFRYVIFKIDENRKEVVVEKTGGPSEGYDDFTDSLPEADCRYAVFDFDFVTSENCQKSKIFFIAWSPSVSRIRSKMLYATSKDRFRRELQGIHYEIQATDPTEMDLEVIRERVHIIVVKIKPEKADFKLRGSELWAPHCRDASQVKMGVLLGDI